MDVVVSRTSLRTDETTVVTSEGLPDVGVDVEVVVARSRRSSPASPDPPLPSFSNGSAGHKDVW